MDTKVLEKFCPWARVELIDAVHNRCVQFSLDDAGRAAYPAGSDVIGTGVIGSTEKLQRDRLFARIETMGYNAFCEQAAYTWFNRFAGIRYMELHGYLSCGVRMLSGADGSFYPECLRVVSELDLPGLDLDKALDLASAGRDEELFRLIFVAQCNELAEALPAVFDHVDDEDALTLPDNLLTASEHNVLYHLVTDIPEDAWQDVEILGWMYQFYNAELKADFFKSKRKAAVEDIAPATQLFTPEWIVRYMVDNSLGRLWMLNYPESTLPERAHAENPADRLMEYYIAPDGEHENFIRISGPEDITFCDPACGSGHILVYAFKMLFALYEERGYREREIPELILTKNLAGLEIDPRAAQIAQLALALCARKNDRRFFTRDVVANVQVLESIEIDASELPEASALVRHKHLDLLESFSHLSEIGSLLTLDEGELGCLQDDAATLANIAEKTGDAFLANTSEKLAKALKANDSLSRRFDVVVANPPYMGSSSFNPFMSKWVKKHYPDSCKDLCTAFIERILGMLNRSGLAGITGTNSWMFLSSFEALRNMLIDDHDIVGLVQLSVHGFKGIAAQVCTGIFSQAHTPGAKGAYIRLNDFDHHSLQKPKTLEAIQNPDCGWFYRADAQGFHDIPGSPIAYWASEAVHRAFVQGTTLSLIAPPRQGLATSNNNRFLRKWWETTSAHINYSAESRDEAKLSGSRWFPIIRGGDYRKWYGNLSEVVDWYEDGKDMKAAVMAKYPYLNNPNFVIKNPECYFSQAISWSKISSGRIAFRFEPKGMLFEVAGPCIFADSDTLSYLLGLFNSSVVQEIASLLSPTLNYEVGQIASYPVLSTSLEEKSTVKALVAACRSLSTHDWDTQETSWNYIRSPLLERLNNDMTKSTTLLIGNGLNRSLLNGDKSIWDADYVADEQSYLTRDASWGAVLRALASRHGISDNFSGNPEEFDDLAAKALEKQPELENVELDSFEPMALRFIAHYFKFVSDSPLDHLNTQQAQLMTSLHSLANKNLSIVSTNFDILLEKILFPDECPYQFKLTSNYPSQTPTFKMKGVSIFHAHGTIQRGESIVLGKSGYLRNIKNILALIDFKPNCTDSQLVSHLETLLERTNDYGNYAQLDEHIVRNKDHLLSSRNMNLQGTWLGKMLFSGVSIIGLGLSKSEIDLWLALYIRKRLRELNDRAFPTDTAVRYFCKKGTLNASEYAEFFEARDVEVIEIEAASYEEVYLRALELSNIR